MVLFCVVVGNCLILLSESSFSRSAASSKEHQVKIKLLFLVQLHNVLFIILKFQLLPGSFQFNEPSLLLALIALFSHLPLLILLQLFL